MAKEKKDPKSLLVSQEELAQKATKGIKEEIFSEQVESFRDYLKGIYRLRNDKEKQIKSLQLDIKKIDEVIAETETGEFDRIKEIAVPAKYLSEKTVRMNDMNWEDME